MPADSPYSELTPLQRQIISYRRKNPEDTYRQMSDALGCSITHISETLRDHYDPEAAPIGFTVQKAQTVDAALTQSDWFFVVSELLRTGNERSANIAQSLTLQTIDIRTDVRETLKEFDRENQVKLAHLRQDDDGETAEQNPEPAAGQTESTDESEPSAEEPNNPL